MYRYMNTANSPRYRRPTKGSTRRTAPVTVQSAQPSRVLMFRRRLARLIAGEQRIAS